MTSAVGGGDGSVRGPVWRPMAIAAAAPSAFLIAALGVVAGAVAGLATCALLGLV